MSQETGVIFKVAAALPVALAVGLAVTNPTEEQHQREMVSHLRANCLSAAQSRPRCGAALKGMAQVELDDHLFFSTARAGGVETFGALGSVVVVSE